MFIVFNRNFFIKEFLFVNIFLVHLVHPLIKLRGAWSSRSRRSLIEWFLLAPAGGLHKTPLRNILREVFLKIYIYISIYVCIYMFKVNAITCFFLQTVDVQMRSPRHWLQEPPKLRSWWLTVQNELPRWPKSPKPKREKVDSYTWRFPKKLDNIQVELHIFLRWLFFNNFLKSDLGPRPSMQHSKDSSWVHP